MIALILVSFIAGILSILAPCVLPVLPVVLAGSLGEKNKWYPYVIVFSLAVSIVLFTVALKATTVFLNVPPGVWTFVSAGIVLFLGLTYLFPHVWTRFAAKAGSSKLQNRLEKTGNTESALFRAVLTGMALGPVFSSCSPTYSLLLASVFPVSLLEGTFLTFVYASGFSFMLLLVVLWGQKITAKLRPFADESGPFRKILGGLLVFVSILIFTGVDKKIETAIIGTFNVNSIEERVLEKILPLRKNADVPTKEVVEDRPSLSESKVEMPEMALDGSAEAPWTASGEWINSPPLDLEALRGKVVIVDFWTYSCINCQRTLPYLVALDKKYRDKGLVIIGAHAPEFAFERRKENVEKAVKEAGITYPVVLDNDFALWRAYENRYWPAKYFIDKKGKLRHFHFGEGGYEETEKIVRFLLSENGGEQINGAMLSAPDSVVSDGLTPETYLGTARRKNKTDSFQNLLPGEWSLSGEWKEEKERVISVVNAKLSLDFSAQDLYLVLSGSGIVKVSVNKKNVALSHIFGKDAESGSVKVDSDRLYHLVHGEGFLKNARLDLEFSSGIGAFAFTFGGGKMDSETASGGPSVMMAADPAAEGLSGYRPYSKDVMESALKIKRKVFIAFHADWCPSCVALDQSVTSDVLKIPKDVLILRADFDSETALRQNFGVTVQTTVVALNPEGTVKAKKLWARNLSEIISINKDAAFNDPITPNAMTANVAVREDSRVSIPQYAEAYFAGGCFWCMEGIFEAQPGVGKAVAGYAGGTEEDADYEKVSAGNTGHREAVKIVYDPAKIAYSKLVDLYLTQIDPTQADGQFADRGYRYTTAVLYVTAEEKRIAEAAIEKLAGSKKFADPVAVKVEPKTTFFDAEEYHQDYYKKSAFRYGLYKMGSGRAAFIEKNWSDEIDALSKTDPKKRLSAIQFEVTQESGTELPFKNEYWDNHREGLYVDVVDGTPLFSSRDKYDSGTGWPSFTKPIRSENVIEKVDESLFSTRTEVRSKSADSHLGHVFEDGPKDRGGLRYCMNSAALRFVPAEDLEKEGYGDFTAYFTGSTR